MPFPNIEHILPKIELITFIVTADVDDFTSSVKQMTHLQFVFRLSRLRVLRGF